MMQNIVPIDHPSNLQLTDEDKLGTENGCKTLSQH